MKNTLALASSLAVLVLAGCASQIEKKTASGSYTYTKSEEHAALKVPSDVDKPEFSEDYAIPPVGEGADSSLIGRKIYVQSPALVLPLVTGSHVEDGNRSATVLFDQVDDSQPLNKAIWNSLLSFLDEQGIGVDSFDPEAGRLVTDWMVLKEEDEEDASWYEFSGATKEIGRRFEFTLEMKPHGRSAALHANLKDYMASKGKDVTADINELDERREEVNILNRVINHYEYQIQLEDSRRIAEIRQGFGTEMGFDKDGDPAFVVDTKYDIAWPRLLLVLRKLGFDVKDLDKSTGLLFVTYRGAEGSWWNNLFSGDDDLLEEDDYRLKIGNLGDKTSVTFMNNESEPFNAKEVSDLYGPFAKVMSEDNLDI